MERLIVDTRERVRRGLPPRDRLVSFGLALGFLGVASAFLALALPIAMSVGREAGLNPVVCALAVMMTGDAVVYYPAQSSSALVIYERGHVSAGEIFRFGLWMTLLGWVTVLLVALPWWSLVGQSLVQR